ncbi:MULTISPECIES: hybrid sensor histidine kinase/response regulator [Arthrospira]|uniref:histidine kinase n=1 Tax=Limnospira platensis NIES-46 TaxID=1236695 RepID=A0A5M3TCF1_LIMPL|nr:ATP-binding protein [Arthrospira platensis]AMW30458.1 histidine kinase [Arthrospira platensis YZ]KDR57942.1 histidine kinase [Arthrospira platensis str. Paraca]MBD2710822.1 response regulator [Arthrospira platensis FACHB-835]MDF2207598.1 ATP-binding protein [Arthrospira platensis NCB002]MDT9295323.1 ATP-binding protein [Arthrospira platensis PCC 7345]MDT9311060.1 ATP-binding protein [Limnospira sp. Paracas R14]QQW28404.1 ATP-binding protein [Arthrospira sp. PCC 9108]BAI93146.1 two-compon
MNTVQIMIVEDELLIAKGLARKLKSLGYTVVGIVSSGIAAIEKVAETNPDLVLMDIVIKGDMDGIETAAKIQEKYGTPVIYLTAYADDSTLERAESTGSYGYLLKPFKEREVHAAIRMALKRYEQEVQVKESLNLFQELEAEKTRLLSIASHDLKNPLTSIQMSTDLLAKYDSKLDEQKKLKHFQRIQSSINSMNQLLEDVLTLSKSSSGKLTFAPKLVNVVKFIQLLIDQLMVQVNDQHKLELRTSGDLDDPIMLDDKLLGHILANLLSNAIKYSPDGGVINFDVIRQENQIIFRIKDAGIGFPPEYIQKLFQAFERGSNVGNIKGTGLGLSIVKQAVDLHGGEITVDSELGQGTTFTVILPITEVS